MTKQPTFWSLCLLCLAAATAPAAEPAPRYADRWFYAPHNLLVDRNVDEVITLLGRAGKSGYNGVLLADYKFNILGRMPPNYFRNVERVKRAAAAAGIEIVPAVFPVGYSDGLLAHDPHLAEGLPVEAAPFVVRGGEAVPVPDPAARVVNGDFERRQGDRFADFLFQDGPGVTSFADTEVAHHGRASCRMQDVGKHDPHGHCRLAQRVRVRPDRKSVV